MKTEGNGDREGSGHREEWRQREVEAEGNVIEGIGDRGEWL